MTQDVVQLAMGLAIEYHEGQKYGKSEYFSGHIDPVTTQAEVIAAGLGWEPEQVRFVVASAYLHDIIEDTECEELVLHDCGIPRMVIDSVVYLTKDPCESYSQYLHAILQSRIAVVVKLADSMVNLRACLSDGKIEQSLKYANNVNFLTAAMARWNK